MTIDELIEEIKQTLKQQKAGQISDRFACSRIDEITRKFEIRRWNRQQIAAKRQQVAERVEMRDGKRDG